MKPLVLILKWDPWKFFIEKCIWRLYFAMSYSKGNKKGCNLGFSRENKGEMAGEIKAIWDFCLALGVKCHRSCNDLGDASWILMHP